MRHVGPTVDDCARARERLRRPAARLRDPAPVAFHEPDTTARADLIVELSVWGATWGEGVLHESETSTGLHVLHPRHDLLADPAALG